MTGANVIETMGLSKLYARSHAVRNLNLAVRPGRITAFLGLNGAGKSTTIRMLLGMIRPSEGTGTVLGRRIDDPVESVSLRKDVAYVSEDKRLYNYMTVEQMIRFTSGFFPGWRDDVASTLLRRYELPAGRKVRHLSKGMRTKLALLLAIARRPALLILDEPSEGLDPQGVEQLLEALVAQCAEGTTVFFSSHQIEEVERISDQVCIIHRGHLSMDAPLDELRESWRRVDVVLPGGTAAEDFEMQGVERVRTRGQQMSVVASRNLETRARFLICLAGITVLCTYRVYGPNQAAPSWAQTNYYLSILRSGQQLLQLMWLVAVTLLMMGGLLQEKANGSVAFTLALPVSRARLMNVRICAELVQAALLIVVPWVAMYATFYFTGPARPISQVLFCVVVLAGGGAVFVAAALLTSSLVEGAYTAPTISAGVALLCANAPRSLAFMNPMAFMDGRDYMEQANLAVRMPWGHVAAYVAVAALMIVASVKVTERRDF